MTGGGMVLSIPFGPSPKAHRELVASREIRAIDHDASRGAATPDYS
jgi:hypothetical protein